jgi:hypothetical protein
MTNPNDISSVDARNLDLDDWRQWSDGLDVDSLFVTPTLICAELTDCHLNLS